MKKPGFSLESQFKEVEKALQSPKTPRQLVPSLQRRAKELSIAMRREQAKPSRSIFAILRKKG